MGLETMRFFCDKFTPFCEKNSITKNLFFEFFFKNLHNCLQHEGALKIFVLSYFEYCQVWLNILVMIVS
jgi:hypothetical protein